MALEVPQLKRGFLGYRRSGVDRLIMEREELFVAAVKEKGEMSIRLDEATEEVARLRTELVELRDEAEAGRMRVAELDAQLDDSRSRIGDLEAERDDLERRVAEQIALVRSSDGRLEVIQADLDLQKRMTGIAGERATRAEALASERHEEIGDLRSHVERVEAEAREAKAALDARAREPGHGPPSRDDVVAAFDVAEEAMDRIVHDHRRRASEELELLERRQDDVRRETERLEASANRMRAVRARLGGSVRQASTRIECVDEAIRGALRPLLDSLSALQRGMDELDDPPVVTWMASEHETADAPVAATSPEDVAVEDLSAIETDLLCWLPVAEGRH